MSDMGLGQNGVLQVIPPGELDKQDAARASAAAAARQPSPAYPNLVGYIKGQFEIFRNHRNTMSGWSERLLHALRAFNGQYSPSQFMEVQKFGGSTIYARITSQKCRAASSLLRDIYLGQDRPWAIRPPSNPDVPDDIIAQINQLLQQENQLVTQQLGKPPDPNSVWKRRQALMDSAEDAAKQKATQQARESEDRIEDMLRDGGFYTALAEFLVYLPIFPFAVLKGPVVKVLPEVIWPPGGGQPTVKYNPKLTWNTVNPFDLWFTPGVSDIKNANMIEKLRVTRAELNDLLDLPGYNVDEVRAVLDEYGRGGLYDNWDTTDAERSVLENKENPAWNRSGLISMMEFNGNCQGRLLQDYGMAVPDELRDYFVQVWCIGSHVIKANLSPSPRQRHPYFLTSFEKVPGTPIGNGLTDLLSDMQDAANATLRSLVNNMAIASGPQVVVNDDRLSPDETGEELYPWKRWHVRNDPATNNSAEPIGFFMPTSNAQQLIQVYQQFVSIADDVSAIPKYVGGEAGGGGAGRTASGLAMLMGNASKILQTVSANIDRDVMDPALTQLADLIMLTDTSGLLTGEEKISVQGVNVAIQRETIRQRQIEFLQATINPVDQKIVGLKGRANILRSVSSTIGLEGDEIVPNEDQIEKMQQQEQVQQQNGPMTEAVQKGVIAGAKMGVQSITKELTAGQIAAQMNVPEGPPAHIGTPEPPQGGQPGSPQPGGPALAQIGQGTKPAQIASHAQGPQSLAPHTNVVGNQPGAGANPVSPGVG
jgi:hypothetical protein